jgi:hypothetical protein
MDIKEVGEGLIQGKKYQLPEWGNFYIFNIENAIMIKSIHTEPMIYNLHTNEVLSNEWKEVLI